MSRKTNMPKQAIIKDLPPSYRLDAYRRGDVFVEDPEVCHFVLRFKFLLKHLWSRQPRLQVFRKAKPGSIEWQAVSNARQLVNWFAWSVQNRNGSLLRHLAELVELDEGKAPVDPVRAWALEWLITNHHHPAAVPCTFSQFFADFGRDHKDQASMEPVQLRRILKDMGIHFRAGKPGRPRLPK